MSDADALALRLKKIEEMLVVGLDFANTEDAADRALTEVRAAISNLEAALAAPAEPACYGVMLAGKVMPVGSREQAEKLADQAASSIVPLYAAPQAAGERQAELPQERNRGLLQAAKQAAAALKRYFMAPNQPGTSLYEARSYLDAAIKREEDFIAALAASHAAPRAGDCCEGQGTCSHNCAWGRGYEAARQQIAAPVAAQPAEPTLGDLIRKVGGRINDAGYVEFGSEMAVLALVRHARAAQEPRKPQPLTEEQIEDCIDEANRLFNGRRQRPSGQQSTSYDDWKHWLARAVERAHGISGESAHG